MPKTNITLDRDRARGTGIWYAYYNEFGRNDRKSMKTKDEAEAQLRFADFLRDQGDDNQMKKAGVVYTVEYCWGEYTTKKLAKGRSLRRATYKWNSFMKAFFGKLTPEECTNRKVQEYVEARLSGKITNKRGVVPSEPTVRGEVELLRFCLNFCSHKDHMQELFSNDLVKPWQKPAAGKPRDRYLELHEIDALYAAARGMRKEDNLITRAEAFLWLAFGTAGREDAIKSLTFDPRRVNFQTRVIDLDDGERQEGDKGRAFVYMNDDLYVILKQLLAQSDQSIPLAKRYVLPGPRHASVWPTIQRIVYYAGLAPEGWTLPKRNQQPKKTGISAHTLRHSAATHMALNGVSLFKIAKYLGNSVEMVEKVYAKYQPKHLQEEANMLNRGTVHLVKGTGVAP